MKTSRQRQAEEQHELNEGIIASGKLNEVIIVETRRADGSLRIQQDFQYCPSMAEQHTGHLSDLNYLMEKYKPDELAQYLAARTSYRQEIREHDFSKEPSLQEAKNVIYQSKQAFLQLPEEIRTQFQSHLEFLKFLDNPANAEKMLKMGLLTKTQIKEITIPDDASNAPDQKSQNANLNANKDDKSTK